MLSKDYYLRLGVSRRESPENIRHAFCEQVKRYHPERVGAARGQFFDELVEAYHMLSHAGRRQEYDRDLSNSEFDVAADSPPMSSAAGVSGVPQVSPALRARSIFLASRFEAALARASRNLTEATADERRYPDGLDLQVVLSAAEALKGGILQLTVPSCSPCRQCGGAGREGLFPCALCDGEGLRQETETLRVRVPENVGDGRQINVPLRGLGPHNFYLCVRIRVPVKNKSTDQEEGIWLRQSV
jgi:molecular chaperone DnaJ